MKIFISGPITGKPEYNRQEFDKAEHMLSAAGHTVLSPAKLTPMNNPEAIPHDDYMLICFVMIDVCDAVYFLRGWSASIGSRLEYELACTRGKALMFQSGGKELFLEAEDGQPIKTHEVINREQHS